MRGSEPGELLKIVVALLENQVLPLIETPSGRATLLLSVGMLDNLAERVEERRDLADRERVLAEQLTAALPERVRSFAEAHPSGPSERPVAMSQLISAFRALVAQPALLREPETDAWLLQCHQALRERTRDEVALLNPTRYLRSQNA
jgi:hypothetical protein